jgi:hypothetical protein
MTKDNLAALVRLYFEQVEAFNSRPNTDGETDAEANALLEATCNATLRQMIGIPAVSAGDALAALHHLEEEGADLESMKYSDSLYDDVFRSLLNAIRGYLEGRAQR